MNSNHLLINLFGILACYVVNSVADVSILDGTLAASDQFPYQVSLQLNNVHTCGGVIVSHRHILTAAHCVLTPFNNFRVGPMAIVAGTNNLNNKTNPRYVHIEVEKIYVPREFNPMSSHYNADISILKLRNSLEFHKNQHLKTLRLPRSSRESYVNRVAKISGFGVYMINRLTVDGATNDGQLRWAEADVIDNNQCRLTPRDRPVTEKQICARVKQYTIVHRGACAGDDGGPLVINSVVIGLLSLYPQGCTEKIRPAVYTRVSLFKDFIKRSMEDRPLPDTRTLVLHQQVD